MSENNENLITIYSNGVARVERKVPISGDGPIPISLPVRKSCLSDVLATLKVRGPVKINTPPSYNNESSKTLTLNSSTMLDDLITKLSGAEVKVSRGGNTYKGKLLGMQNMETTSQNGEISDEPLLLLLTGNGVKMLKARECDIEYVEQDVVRLIEKAVASNFEKVRPDSAMVQFSVTPTDPKANNIMLDYALPTAAWQSVYSLNINKKKAKLKCSAKIDNPTDEDWLNTKVCVVVGEPISMKTSLDKVMLPDRAEVDLVAKRAVGPVRAATAMRRAKGFPGDDATSIMQFAADSESFSPRGIQGSPGYQGPQGSRGDDESIGDINYCALPAYETAAAPGAVGEEIGNFAKFTSEEVIDIRANLSGVVKLFDEEIEADEVLFYDSRQDAERSYRGVRLTNNTKNSLGQGVVTVYIDGLLAGQDDFKGCKIGQTKTINFARENGVEVSCKRSVASNKRMSLQTSNGELRIQDRISTEVNYHFDNLYKDQDFDLEIDHRPNNAEAEITVSDKSIKVEKTKTGVKLHKLAQNAALEFKVTEVNILKSSVAIQAGVPGWGNLIAYAGDFADYGKKLAASDTFRKVQQMVADLGSANIVLKDLIAEVVALKEEQKRLLELCKAGNAKWESRINDGEERISTVERKEIPSQKKKIQELESKIADTLKNFTFDWTEKAA